MGDKVGRYFGGRNVLLTGASSGIGSELALALAGHGANLYALGRDRDRLALLEERWRKISLRPNQELRTIGLELRDAEAIAALGPRLESAFPVEVLINCAGVAHTDYLVATTCDQIVELVATNLTASALLTRLVLPGMKERGSGHIAFVSSLAAVINFTGYTVYGATKAGLLSFATGLQRECATDRVTVSVLLPGDVDTPMLARERVTSPVETRRISGAVKPLEAERVARALLDGMAAGRFLVVPGVRAKFVLLAARLTPRAVADRLLRPLARGGG